MIIEEVLRVAIGAWNYHPCREFDSAAGHQARHPCNSQPRLRRGAYCCHEATGPIGFDSGRVRPIFRS